MQHSPTADSTRLQAGGAECTNILDLAPDSWLLELIRMLPAKDRLSLFQVSRPLASAVVQCAAKVGLQISISHEQQLAPGEVDVRRSLITQLLLKRQRFAVRMLLRSDSPAPFPTDLSSQIISLDVMVLPDAGTANSCIAWHALSNLIELEYWCLQNSDHGVSMLCDALEARHMQQLKKLKFFLNRFKLADSVFERLAHAVGPQLQELSIDVALLVTHLPLFTVLHTIELQSCSLTSLQAERLCEHASLHRVYLEHHVRVEGDHRQRACGWETLAVGALGAWGALLSLPLAGVQNIYAMESVVGQTVQENHILQSVLSQHAHKFTCQPVHLGNYPGMPTFTLHYPSGIMLPLLAHLHVTCRLCLRWHAKAEPQGTSILHAVWKVLPTCVLTILIDGYHWQQGNIDWARLWQGLPEHVHTFEVVKCAIPADGLCTIVRTAPKHISVFVLVPCSEAQHTSWEAAGIHDCVPEHITLQMGPNHSYW